MIRKLILVFSFFVASFVIGVLAKAGFAVDERSTIEPFATLITRLTTLFYATRNLVFVASGFAMIVFAAKWIKEGKVDFAQLGWLVVALIVLAIAGDFIEYAVYHGTDIEASERIDLANTIADVQNQNLNSY